MKIIEVEAHFTKTVTEKTILEIEIDDEDLKKINSDEITLEECVHDYVYDYNYEVIDIVDTNIEDETIEFMKITKS